MTKNKQQKNSSRKKRKIETSLNRETHARSRAIQLLLCISFQQLISKSDLTRLIKLFILIELLTKYKRP